MGEISLSRGFSFFLFVTSIFASSRDQTGEPILRCLIYRMSIPGCCIARGIKLQKVSDFPNFTPETPPKWA